jgi:hypothetical protein
MILQEISASDSYKIKKTKVIRIVFSIREIYTLSLKPKAMNYQNSDLNISVI